MRWESRKPPGMNCGEQAAEQSSAVVGNDREKETAGEKRRKHHERVWRRRLNVAVRVLLLIAIALIVAAALNRIAMMTDSDWRSVITRLLVG